MAPPQWPCRRRRGDLSASSSSACSPKATTAELLPLSSRCLPPSAAC
uniref:Uncharacterized protein n=1 Tax=Arundo donax TaxID=35708 RepID=A0A0A9EXW8_ARUDO